MKPFNIIDRLTYGIEASFETAETGAPTVVSLYSRNDELPHKPRRLTFPKKFADFAIRVSYDSAAVALLPTGQDRLIAVYTIKVKIICFLTFSK